MSPQPIDQVKYGARYRLHFDTLNDRKDVAQAVTECIAKWAGVELNLGFLFTSLLHTNEQQGAELYASFDGITAKKSALKALCLSTLQPQENELVDRLLALIKSRQRTRDKLAHWVIGSSDEIADAIVLVDPKTIWSVAGGSAQDFREAFEKKHPRALSRPVPRDKVYVFKRADIERATESFIRLAAIVLKLTSFAKQRPDSPLRLSLFVELDRDVRQETG